jgi:hypothetical protein
MDNYTSRTGVATTSDWLKATEGMMITAYDPSAAAKMEVNVVEPGRAVHLPAADRARMNHAKSGVHTPPERL